MHPLANNRNALTRDSATGLRALFSLVAQVSATPPGPQLTREAEPRTRPRLRFFQIAKVE